MKKFGSFEVLMMMGKKGRWEVWEGAFIDEGPEDAPNKWRANPLSTGRCWIGGASSTTKLWS